MNQELKIARLATENQAPGFTDARFADSVPAGAGHLETLARLNGRS